MSGIPNVAVTIEDAAAVVIDNSGGSTAVTEGGSTYSYQVSLTSQPTSPVTVTVTADAQTLVNGSASVDLIFDDVCPGSNCWSTLQTVTVAAVDDAAVEGPHSSTITHSTSSADGKYNNLPGIPDVIVAVVDNDPPPPASFLIGNGTASTIDLSWSSVGGVSTYELLRATNASMSGAVVIYSGSGSSLTDSGLTASTRYYYAVRSVASGVTGSLSPVRIGNTLDANGMPANLVSVGYHTLPAIPSVVDAYPPPTYCGSTCTNYWLYTKTDWYAGGYHYYVFDPDHQNWGSFAIGAYNSQGIMVNSWSFTGRYITGVTISSPYIVVTRQSGTTNVTWSAIYPP